MLDKGAFTEKARQLQGPMYRVACGILRNEADRQDAMQTALKKAWEKRRSLRDAVERLPEKQRVCVMLHYLEGLPTDEEETA